MSEFSREDMPEWYRNSYWLLVWEEEWQDQEQLKWELNHAEERRFWKENTPSGFVN